MTTTKQQTMTAMKTAPNKLGNIVTYNFETGFHTHKPYEQLVEDLRIQKDKRYRLKASHIALQRAYNEKLRLYENLLEDYADLQRQLDEGQKPKIQVVFVREA